MFYYHDVDLIHRKRFLSIIMCLDLVWESVKPLSFVYIYIVVIKTD